VATGKPVVLVLFTGRPLTLEWEAEHVPAMLNVWFGGTQAAEAIGDVLFGDVNPSGKLPATFPRSVGQIPLFYNHKNTGRPLLGDKFEKFRSNYLDVPNTPLYPFGYGLSYTTFKYDNVKLSSANLKKEDVLTVTFDLENTGKYEGTEVAQLYVQDKFASVTRPVKELKRFARVTLKPGEKKNVSFELPISELAFWNIDMVKTVEAGDFALWVAPDSQSGEEVFFKVVD
jgi:beta-glucosidase